MSELHICWTPLSQPATDYTIDLGDIEEGRKAHIAMPAHRLIWCSKCRRRRHAKNMRVIAQAWYDSEFFCETCPPKPKRKRRKS